MEIALYDHRRERGEGFHQDLGKIKRFSLTASGDLRIPKTDLLFSLDVHFTMAELNTLWVRICELHEKKKLKRPVVIEMAQNILKEH
jgi:hypothetical protein